MWLQNLTKKHTVFGKITGDSIFNLLRFNTIEVDSDDKPVKPPKILSVQVVWNPFDDIVVREISKPEKPKEEKPKINAPIVRNFNLLSFGDEAKEDEETEKLPKIINQNPSLMNAIKSTIGDDEPSVPKKKKER